MTELATINTQVPAFLQAHVAHEMELSKSAVGGISGHASLPTLSISGKEFSVVADGTRTTLDERDLDVIIVDARPSISKRLFAQTFGSEDKKPTCASIDGKLPDFPPRCVDPETGAAPSCCETCYFNRFGTAEQGKGRACKDYKRIVVMLANPNDGTVATRHALTLDIPATSLKAPKGSNLSMFRELYDKVVTRGNMPLSMVVTRLKFVKGLTFPQLTFEPVGYVTEEQYKRVVELRSFDETRASLDDKYTYREDDEETAPSQAKPSSISVETVDDEITVELDSLLTTM